jgi:outer membrane protein TolC
MVGVKKDKILTTASMLVRPFKNTLPTIMPRKPVIYLAFFLCFWNVLALAAEKFPAPEQAVTSSNATLVELEQHVTGSASVASEVALLEELQAELAHEQEIAGWKIIGSARGGYTNEQLTSNERKEYYPTQVTAGLTYPLFGKLKKEKANLLDLEAGAENEQLKVEIRRREAIEQVRLNYILLWGAEQKIALAKTFLSDKEGVRDLLLDRRNLGHLLSSDYFDFMTALDRVERESLENQLAAERARDIIEIFTAVRLASPLAYVPDLPMTCENLAEGLEMLDQNPEILLYQNMVDLQLKQQRYSRDDVEGNITVRGFASTSEEVNTDFGYGGMVSMDVVMPLNPFAADSKKSAVTQQRLRRYQQELRVKTEEIKLSLTDRLRNFTSERIKKRDNITQLQAATALLREKTLRRDRIDGDVLEQYQKAAYRYYRAAYDFIDGEVRLLQSAAQLLRFCPEGTVRQSLVTPYSSVIRPLKDSLTMSTDGAKLRPEKIPAKKSFSDSAVYVWNSSSFFDGTFSPLLFQQHSIEKVLISLNADQLAYIDTPEGAAHLWRILAYCEQKGLTISLLLGEPSWILPEFRSRLMKILQLANKFSFASVHLDMEPSQLDTKKYGLEYLSAQFLRTLQVATEISKHPLEISIHPRLLDKNQTNICFGCGLTNLDLKRVVVMIYRTDIQVVAKQMAGFSKEFPNITWAVAQSVEPSLGAKNSYAHHGLETFEQVRQRLENCGDSIGWCGDVYIQDWTSYRQLLDAADLQQDRNTK